MGSPEPWRQRPPNDGEAQMPASIPVRSVSKSTQHRARGLVYLSTAYDSLTEDHISVVLFLCFGEESAAAFIDASLSRDETGEQTSDLTMRGSLFLSAARHSKLFLPPIYSPVLPFSIVLQQFPMPNL